VPEEVTHCVEAPDVGMPGPGEIVFDVLAFPINPADLSMCRGNYRLRPALPATPGAECVGRVAAAGPGVTGIKPGDLVINMQRENWTQRRRVDAKDAIPLPTGLDLAQAAMLRINPATALLLLEDHVALKPGEWVIQNAANSAVGVYLVQLARHRGFRTVNVVRREDAAEVVRETGGDVVLLDGEDLARRVSAAIDGAQIRLGIDAVAGAATGHLADCLCESATLVSYGRMSGEPCGVQPDAFVFRDLTLRGFWLARWFQRAPEERRRAIVDEIAGLIATGKLHAPIQATYDVSEIKDAVAAAAGDGRSGKILIVPRR
jgi:NADPH:quinone reductase-like Zn-dependent oxidoreductase